MNVSQYLALAHPAVTLSEHDGIRYLHLGSDAIQGAMRIAHPFALELTYIQQMMSWMLFLPEPQRITQLGLGAASLTKFCYQHFPQAQLSAIELNPHVIASCRKYFALPANDARLQVMAADAWNVVNDVRNHGLSDILQVDLYDAAAHAPVLGSLEFYRACAACLQPHGILTVNLHADQADYVACCDAHLSTLAEVFDAVVWLPQAHPTNTIALAFKTSPNIDFELLTTRALHIVRDYGLPAHTWVDGLVAWMSQAE